MEIKDRTSLGDIDRGIKSGAPKRVLYQDLSKIADASRSNAGPVVEAVKKGLGEKAKEIHGVVTVKS